MNFKFAYFSDCINKSTIASETAAKQGKFKLMHNEIFENREALHQDSIYFRFAHDLGMDIEIFSKDMNNDTMLKRLMDNKNYLIVNNKILDYKCSILYLEEIITEELNKK